MKQLLFLVVLCATFFGACRPTPQMTGPSMTEKSVWLLDHLQVGDTLQGYYNPRMESFALNHQVEYNCHPLQGDYEQSPVCETMDSPWCFFITVCDDEAALPAMTSRFYIGQAKNAKLTLKVGKLPNNEKILIPIW